MLAKLLGLSAALGCLIVLQDAPENLNLQLRYQRPIENGGIEQRIRVESWIPTETAIIVCDVWDKHHCLNAVRRMEEFLPRMNDVLTKAREKGVVIIHAPSDCMPAYEGAAARQRAIDAPKAANLPADIEFWCSKIPAEEQSLYPIDQSDGGEDDDPEEHARWAAELKALGRNPAMPWKSQSAMIQIDQTKDYISDRGDEVWNILESHQVKNVILVGVHTNMCVLGRPFGLRQMARNGKRVVLMRDLTDCMYNPKRWPFTDHFSGNDLIVSHIERFVCPTTTSDQILGGAPFVSKYDTRKTDRIGAASIPTIPTGKAPDWARVNLTTQHPWDVLTTAENEHVVWLRCSVRLPSKWVGDDDLRLSSLPRCRMSAWLNGTALTQEDSGFLIPKKTAIVDDINLLVLRVELPSDGTFSADQLAIQSSGGTLSLHGTWQARSVDDPANANIPLPAKFGMSPDVLFEPTRK